VRNTQPFWFIEDLLAALRDPPLETRRLVAGGIGVGMLLAVAANPAWLGHLRFIWWRDGFADFARKIAMSIASIANLNLAYLAMFHACH
jgi:hypothetical protein